MGTHVVPPRLSIVIPSYNGCSLLATCLTSIEWCAPREIPIEVIVVDDASTDGTADWLSLTYPWVRCVVQPTNGGFCRAANAGIAAARAPIVQMLNNDTEVTSGWVEAGLAPFDDPKVGAVAPLVLMRGDPSRVDSAGDGYWWFGMPYKRGRGELASKWRQARARTVFGASGSTAFYRTDLLRRLGGFDTRFGSYYEDTDLAFRLRRLRTVCRFVPGCVILHEVSATYDHSDPALQRRMARNAELIFWTRVPVGIRLAAMMPHVAFVGAQLVHRALTGRAAAFVAGKMDAARWLFSARAHREPLAGPHARIAGTTMENDSTQTYPYI